MNSRCSHDDWKPKRQCGQVLSDMTNEPTTNWPARTVVTALPTSSTMPQYSCPIAIGGRDVVQAAIGPQGRIRRCRWPTAGRWRPSDGESSARRPPHTGRLPGRKAWFPTSEESPFSRGWPTASCPLVDTGGRRSHEAGWQRRDGATGRTPAALRTRGPCRLRHRRLFRGEVAEPVGGGDAAIHEEIAAGDERSVRAHEQGTDVADLVGGTGSPDGAELGSCAR